MIQDKKGQALVEFVIILPVLIMIIFCLIDFGKIFYVKNDLESIMDRSISMYDNNENIEEIKQYVDKNISEAQFSIKYDNHDVIFEIGKKVDIFTPGLNLILGDPYITSVKRTVPNE